MASFRNLSAILLVAGFLLWLAFAAAAAASEEIRARLRRRDYGGQTTEILRRAISRSEQRHIRLQQQVIFKSNTNTSNTNTANLVTADGEFTAEFQLGTPPQNFTAILDTGSDLVWTQCKPCRHCLAQGNALFNSELSKTFSDVSCRSSSCSVLYGSSCGSEGTCAYRYFYGDGSSTAGFLATDTLSVGQTAVSNITFGCGMNQTGYFSGVDGIVGMGRGNNSLVSQISTARTFSYCFSQWDRPDLKSTLFLGNNKGRLAKLNPQTTPLIQNAMIKSLYYLQLESLAVENETLSIPAGVLDLKSDGTGGLIIDSGTTLTSLVDEVYQPLLRLVKNFVNDTTVDGSQAGFDLCYNKQPKDLRLPSLSLYFSGNAAWTLPAQNVFVFTRIADADAEAFTCFAFTSAGPVGSVSTLGNILQQNFLVQYDLNAGALVFATTNCNELSS